MIGKDWIANNENLPVCYYDIITDMTFQQLPTLAI